MDKTVLITGANGGLGSAVTRAFLDAGASVAGVSLSISASEFPSPKFRAYATGLSSRDAVEQLVQQIAADFGRLDAVIHLVGGWAGGHNVEDTGDDAFDRMWALNLKSTVWIISAATPRMRAQKSGRLVAIGSQAVVNPPAGSSAYNVSKAAVVTLMRTLAEELRGTGVTANTVLPSAMDTPQNRAAMPNADPAKWVHPSQVAALLVHLVSDAGAAMSGAALPIFGGEF